MSLYSDLNGPKLGMSIWLSVFSFILPTQGSGPHTRECSGKCKRSQCPRKGLSGLFYQSQLNISLPSTACLPSSSPYTEYKGLLICSLLPSQLFHLVILPPQGLFYLPLTPIKMSPFVTRNVQCPQSQVTLSTTFFKQLLINTLYWTCTILCRVTAPPG